MQFMSLQRVGHDLATEQQQQKRNSLEGKGKFLENHTISKLSKEEKRKSLSKETELAI